MEYTSVERVLGKFHRDLQGTEVSETNLIEWIGEALGFLQVYQIQEEAVAFLEVENYEAELPPYFNAVIQIAKRSGGVIDKCTPPIEEEGYTPIQCEKECEDPCKKSCKEEGLTYLNTKWTYPSWVNSSYYEREYSPIRLSNHSYAHACIRNKDEVYQHCTEEYSIVGTTFRKLRFSFKEGLVALSYIRSAIDKETGYPLIPDDVSYMAAITYYLKWKLSEWYQWNGREGFQSLPMDMERKWLKYARQAKNKAKIPKTIDEYQNMLEQTHSLPNPYKYNNFFGQIPTRRFPI